METQASAGLASEPHQASGPRASTSAAGQLAQGDRNNVGMIGEGRHLSESDNLSIKYLAYCHTPGNGRATCGR